MAVRRRSIVRAYPLIPHSNIVLGKEFIQRVEFAHLVNVRMYRLSGANERRDVVI